jgi:ribosome-binding protein aMBF1 (putative translation factor)
MMEQELNRTDPISGDEKEEDRLWPPSPMPVHPYVLRRPLQRASVSAAEPSAQPAEPAPSQTAPEEREEPATFPRQQKPFVPRPAVQAQSPSGPEIRDARVRLGMTQLELAKRVGRSRSFIALVEQQRRLASEEDLRKLREVLGL